MGDRLDEVNKDLLKKYVKRTADNIRSMGKPVQESEELDEISKGKLDAYQNKAADSAVEHMKKARTAELEGRTSDAEKHRKIQDKREAGQWKAYQRTKNMAEDTLDEAKEDYTYQKVSREGHSPKHHASFVNGLKKKGWKVHSHTEMTPKADKVDYHATTIMKHSDGRRAKIETGVLTGQNIIYAIPKHMIRENLEELSMQVMDRYFTKAAKSRGQAEKEDDQKTVAKRDKGLNTMIWKTKPVKEELGSENEIGTPELVKKYKDATPGQENAQIPTIKEEENLTSSQESITENRTIEAGINNQPRKVNASAVHSDMAKVMAGRMTIAQFNHIHNRKK